MKKTTDSAKTIVRRRGRRSAIIDADFARDGEGTRTVAAAIDALGGIDVLFVCASIQYRTPFEEVTREQVDRQVQVNFKATIELLRAALPPMKARGWGRVLTLGSINETAPEAELSVYAALKCAGATVR